MLSIFLSLLMVLTACQQKSFTAERQNGERRGAQAADSSKDDDSPEFEEEGEEQEESGTEPQPELDDALESNDDEGCQWQAKGDYTKPGPLGFQDGPSGGPAGAFSFLPAKMDKKCKYPVIAFAMGTMAPASGYTGFYQHFASYGFVVVVDPTNNNHANGDSLKHSLDWIYQSEVKGNLSLKAGTTGHSQGGGAAYSSYDHTNVKAIVGLQPGQFRAGQNTRAAYCGLAGTADTFGAATDPNLMHYPQTSGVPKFVASYVGADHVTSMINTQSGPGMYYRAVATAWFRCYLYDDKGACDMFESGTCSGLPPNGSNWTECKGEL